MPAFTGADGPRTARIPLGGLRGAVATLASRPSDGVDRRQVEDVEPHVGHVGQLRPDVGERAGAQGVRRGRAREHLVPRAEAGLLPVGDHREDLRRRGAVRVAAPAQEVRQLIGEDELAQGGHTYPPRDLVRHLARQPGGGRAQMGGGQ